MAAAQEQSAAGAELPLPEGQPHDALFLVLPYLPLSELLAMGQVCVSLRDAVNNGDDVLPWMDLIVQNPLSRRLSDENLVRVSSRAQGRLRTVALFDCFNVTDDGLLLVVHNNPLIHKMYLPGCTSLSPEGVINAVRTLSSSSSSNRLKSLKINGIYNLNKEHLQTLKFYLQTNQTQLQYCTNFLHQFRNTNIVDNNSSIDVEVCPKCDEVRMVFSCPKETCERKKRNSRELDDRCRGCVICIRKCVECGGCLDSEESEEAVCGDEMCLACWLKLPKCNLCNRPYCNQHYYSSKRLLSSGQLEEEEGFICSSCDHRDDDDVMAGGGGGDSDYEPY